MLYLPCPKCNGELQVRVAKRGPRAGFEFYGCDNFPLCKFTAEKTNVVDLLKEDGLGWGCQSLQPHQADVITNVKNKILVPLQKKLIDQNSKFAEL